MTYQHVTINIPLHHTATILQYSPDRTLAANEMFKKEYVPNVPQSYHTSLLSSQSPLEHALKSQILRAADPPPEAARDLSRLHAVHRRDNPEEGATRRGETVPIYLPLPPNSLWNGGCAVK